MRNRLLNAHGLCAWIRAWFEDGRASFERAPPEESGEPERGRAPARAGEAPQSEPLASAGGRTRRGDPAPGGRRVAQAESRRAGRLQRACREAWRVQRGLALLLMAQFDVYRNPNPATRNRVPFLLDVQVGLLDSLATRIVVPLCKPETVGGGEELDQPLALEAPRVGAPQQSRHQRPEGGGEHQPRIRSASQRPASSKVGDRATRRSRGIMRTR